MNEDDLIENPDAATLNPSPGDRVQYILSDPPNVLVLVRVDGLKDDKINGKVLGLFDWDSKAQYTETTGPSEIQTLAIDLVSSDCTIDKKYVHKVVPADVKHKAKWAAGIAISFVKQFYPNARATTLEEIEFDIDSGNWEITVGIIRESSSDTVSNMMFDNIYKDKGRREYKKVSVNPNIGDAVKMTIRDLGV